MSPFTYKKLANHDRISLRLGSNEVGFPKGLKHSCITFIIHIDHVVVEEIVSIKLIMNCMANLGISTTLVQVVFINCLGEENYSVHNMLHLLIIVIVIIIIIMLHLAVYSEIIGKLAVVQYRTELL